MTARLFTLFKVFFNISAFTLGGGLAMLPMLEREFVDRRHWLTSEDMVDTVAVMQSMPGIIAINMAILIGYKAAKIAGVIFAVAGAVLPPFLIITIIAALFAQLGSDGMVNEIFNGVRAAVCALIFSSVLNLSKKVLKGAFEIAMAAIGFILLVFFNANAIYLIIFSGIAGLLFGVFHYYRLKRNLKP